MHRLLATWGAGAVASIPSRQAPSHWVLKSALRMEDKEAWGRRATLTHRGRMLMNDAGAVEADEAVTSGEARSATVSGCSHEQTFGHTSESRLFRKYNAMMSFAPLESGPFALVARNHELFEDAISLARAVGSDVVVFSGLSAILDRILARRSCWSMLLINIDDQDIDLAVSRLSAFRLEFPWQRVVLASRGFRDYDFSQERLAICDASLRIPFGFEGAEKAFFAAEENNREWVQRLTRRHAPSDAASSLGSPFASHADCQGDGARAPHRSVPGGK